MKKIRKYMLVLVSTLLLIPDYGCDSFLEVESLTKISPKLLIADEAGIKTLLAQMYNGIPMEDFNYFPAAGGFNRHYFPDDNSNLTFPAMFTDEATSSNGAAPIGPGGFNMWSASTNAGNINPWDRNRKISVFQKSIEQAKDDGNITETTYNRLWSESYFARAYIYFALVKRYGGVPIIDWLQDDDYIAGGASKLFVPRSTESATWKFILECCDKAIQYLPTPNEFTSTDGDPKWRANKWTAYALKSRAALYAASIAKFGDRVSFPSCEAVEQKLVGIDASEAAFFYNECITASKKIIDEGGYSLYMPNPKSPEEAATNYQNLFMNPTLADVEVIFGITYMDGSLFTKQGHMFDHCFSPTQASVGHRFWGRFSPTLDMADIHEDYTDDGTGKNTPIVTRTDGNENYLLNTNTPSADMISAIPFVKYDDPLDAFKGKDARLHASMILPGSKYKGVTIVMQGGMIRKNGNISLYGGDPEVGLDGKMYYVFGAANQNDYSGFASMTVSDDANYTSTGFNIRKFMGEDKSFSNQYGSCTTPWIDFRLAEIYLNYAEAVVESGLGDATAAAGYINALRRRAGHSDKIPLTLDNVLKERRIELAFENHRIWDLYRRREYHTLFDNYRRKSLVQMIDLREEKPKYVFLRIENFNDLRAGGRTFQIVDYYQNIPGINVSGLPNNPGR